MPLGTEKGATYGSKGGKDFFLIMDGEYKRCASLYLEEVDLKLCEPKVNTFMQFSRFGVTTECYGF